MKNEDYRRKVHYFQDLELKRVRERKRKNPKCGRRTCAAPSVDEFSYQLTLDKIWKRSRAASK